METPTPVQSPVRLTSPGQAALPWRPRVVLMSTYPDAASAITAQHGRDALPFVPKQELAGDRLRRLLA